MTSMLKDADINAGRVKLFDDSLIITFFKRRCWRSEISWATP